MANDTLLEKVKMAFAIFLYFCIIYPIQFIIYPIIRIIYTNIYLFFIWFFFWAMAIMGVFDNFNETFSQKIIEKHIDLMWIIKPIITIFGFEITPITILMVIMVLLLIYRMGEVILSTIDMIKVILGQTLMAVLWLWFTIFGDKDRAVMFIQSPNERRSILIFWGMLVLAIIAVFVFLYFRSLSHDVVSNYVITSMNATSHLNDTVNLGTPVLDNVSLQTAIDKTYEGL